MTNYKTMRNFGIGILGVILLLALSGCTSQSKNQEKLITAELEKANYCTQDEDCTFVGNVCPFGCNLYVNTNESTRITSLLDSYQSTCMYSCVPVSDVRCVNNRCQVSYEQP
ncbi:hypothetical protein HYW21_00330 [Candidatus Woesearchaeota archaeon]|nr:hypothetical protein [Candidatus Woesearchaeota archaeon]